jgi:hypothetical protein
MASEDTCGAGVDMSKTCYGAIKIFGIFHASAISLSGSLYNSLNVAELTALTVEMNYSHIRLKKQSSSYIRL